MSSKLFPGLPGTGLKPKNGIKSVKKNAPGAAIEDIC
ncbi:MAG: YegP family protein [Deltaproteobacteria bacterium]|nr:YegP family protein [Deltaproteobacteria bacterium]NND30670.1 YegP family protein [Myxococcales bacterium]MBT8463942.1 YegP family protein [Deltaproteobacteria bacterium]MBT8483602.1 YegP family protein [Deltaproteobacteria bacterium]NNL26460.1 YegP family protein [Myxococcales bacterium]